MRSKESFIQIKGYLLPLLAVLSGCASAYSYIPTAGKLSPIDGDPAIVLFQTACNGMCPTYRLVVWGNGLTVFSFGSMPHDGIWWRSIAPASVRRLLDRITRIKQARCGTAPAEMVFDAQYVELDTKAESGICSRRFLSYEQPSDVRMAIQDILDATQARSLAERPWGAGK